MTPTQGTFDLTASREARDEGIAVVEENRGIDCARVRAIILRLVERGAEITADDVRREIDWPCTPGALGAAFNGLARKGRIVKTGAFTQSVRVNQHAATLFYWRKA